MRSGRRFRGAGRIAASRAACSRADTPSRGSVVVTTRRLCTINTNEHRRRVETRATDISRLRLPTWQEVISREYHSWGREHFIVDTAAHTVEQSVSMIRSMLRNA